MSLLKSSFKYFQVDKIPATDYLCNKCRVIIIDAYEFIQNTKESTKLINNYINDFISKTIDLNNQLEPDGKYKDSNVIIVLENNEKTDEEPIEIKIINAEERRKKTTRNKAHKEAQKLAEQLKRASANASKPPIKIIKTETLQNINKEEAQKFIAYEKDMIASKKGYECTRCKVTFTTFKLWKEHEKDFHKKCIECEICSKTFDSHRTLTAHYKSHNKLKCRFCCTFVLDTKLQEHLKLNHENETHSCEYCDKIYYTAPALIAHIKISHFNVKTVDENEENPQCLMCLQYYEKEALKTHKCRDKCPDCTEIPCIHYKYLIHFKEQVLNHMSKIKCLDCDYVCRKKVSLIGHVNREHIDYHPFTCTDCGIQFFSKYRLRCHISTYHNDSLKCEFCDKMFSNKNYYDKHIDFCKTEEREFACKECVASFMTADELYSHEKLQHSDESIPCELCNKRFLTTARMLEHKLRIHRSLQIRKQMKWECLLCKKDNKFDTKGEYRQHMQSHGPDVKYICRICNIECKDLTNLQWHNRSHRKKVRASEKSRILKPKVDRDSDSCICDVCGKSMLSKIQLRMHRMTHLDKVPCKVCSKPVKPSTMYQHMLIHKGVKRKPGKCTSACDYCEYKSPSLSSLEAHVNRYHLNIKPYICDICDSAFCTENLLKQHGFVHSDERNYTCELCNKKFRYKSTLRKHMFVHTGEKSHICDICGERFVCSSSMKEHRLRHLRKSVGCPLCDSMFHSVKLLRMHFKKQHWKDKNKKFNPKEILNEEYHYLFEDRRTVPNIDVQNAD